MEKERSLAEYACKSAAAVRYHEVQGDIRPNFSRDADKIIHSYCYSRYIDKTQAFYLVENDHITHRVLHVQLVAKIARTIGRFLNLKPVRNSKQEWRCLWKQRYNTIPSMA